MPYKDKNKQLEYNRMWIANRRKKWINENGPCSECGSRDRLEIHHIDPSTKVTHVVWSWAESRRVTELSKCTVLCHSCHLEKTSIQRSAELKHGTYSMWKIKHCRCESCVLAQRAYKKDYRKRTGIY